MDIVLALGGLADFERVWADLWGDMPISSRVMAQTRLLQWMIENEHIVNATIEAARENLMRQHKLTLA